MEELVEAIKLWRGVRNVELQNASQQERAIDGVSVCAKCGYVKIDNVCLGCESKAPPRN